MAYNGGRRSQEVASGCSRSKARAEHGADRRTGCRVALIEEWSKGASHAICIEGFLILGWRAYGHLLCQHTVAAMSLRGESEKKGGINLRRSGYMMAD